MGQRYDGANLQFKGLVGRQKRLETVSVIRRTVMVLVSLDEVRINLHHVGATDQLKTALGQADLAMVREDDEWVLYPAGLVPLGKS